jgi:aryl-alcohol dehydrogenase-like predicted oxidoreductase
VDIVFAHRFDEFTPLEEICRSFNEIIEEGKAFYWGTSDWDPVTLYQAFSICEQLNLHKPIAAQVQYNMLQRDEV